MNTPQRFEPVQPLTLVEGCVIHTSTRTAVSTNMNPEIGKLPTVAVGSTNLELRVGAAGALKVRYVVQPMARLPARPLGRRMVNARS